MRWSPECSPIVDFHKWRQPCRRSGCNLRPEKQGSCIPTPSQQARHRAKSCHKCPKETQIQRARIAAAQHARGQSFELLKTVPGCLSERCGAARAKIAKAQRLRWAKRKISVRKVAA